MQRRDSGPRNPHGLPTKVCPACGKAFTWRKKWARDWAQVVYCSERCKRDGKRVVTPPAEGGR